ncbi:chain length determinant protein (polysaccharide antigen chain regulator) [Pseudomonas sp. 3296]|uniref:LPS O-antigen chain length determinant protein WzzB n=1 Tax=Pseudomonas sp. 3296 TaxID=2817753 RepID=UPI00285DA714|nr:Wzz/FepE/Etk N-terminal domain-containing protein [Pseudomonas sp. 3296]MDR6917746.1 chain length determinant protein (polysaccharide antigen chain regulator) [Pseudomonas sp. 3296]
MQIDAKDFVAEGLDIHALVFTLWRQKFIILCMALLGTIIATTYAFLSEPIYEAKAFIMPPTQNDIEGLNYGRKKLPPLAVKDVYLVFLKNLQAESLRREFFKGIYLPALGKDSDPKGLLYDKFSKKLLISVVGKDAADRYSIVILDADSSQAAKWVGQYAERAQELALQEINKNISSEFNVEARNLNQEIVSLREVGRKEREDTLVKLNEALVVAKAIGLEKPPIVSGGSKSSLNIAGKMDDELTYMRGTKALEAEIENLKSRKSEDPFIDKLRGLETDYNFYKQLSERFQIAKTFRMDGSVEVSGSPVKPKIPLVISIGLILGLMLGVVIALIRSSLLRGQDNK